MFLNASEMMGEHASKYPLLCVGGFAEDVEEEKEEMVEDSTRRTRITVVAAGGMPAKLVNENFSNRSNAKSLGFSLAKMKVGGKRDGEEENTKTSRVYAWDFIT
jgi:CO dehydrogenase/acetyl-CoA synthase epsilon subunit